VLYAFIMRFTFLGTGTSAGIPAIACRCDVCTSDDPRDKRLRTGAALEFTDPTGAPRVVLIDATPDLRQQALRAGLMRCDAVLFTHNHVDHTFGLDELRRFNAVQHAPIDIFAERHTLEHLRRVYMHIFEAELNINQSFVATLIAHELDPDRPLELFGVRFTPIRLLHGRLPIVGYRIEPASDRLPGKHAAFLPLAYCTDVSAIPPESWRHLRGLGTLVLDALRKRHHPTHFNLDQAINVAERAGPVRTLFIHIAHDLAHQATCDELPESMSIAYDGLVLE
jgi:phosphoribosyl 1,2-cyclic phosphate phosphodiesterase